MNQTVSRAGRALKQSDGSGSAFIALLSAFQRSLWEDLDPCVWYCPYQVEQFKQFPDWFYRNQSQPWATLRPMVERGALRMKKVDLGGGFNVPVFLRPCCDRADEYNGFASGPLLFQCPRSCSCHD